VEVEKTNLKVRMTNVLLLENAGVSQEGKNSCLKWEDLKKNQLVREVLRAPRVKAMEKEPGNPRLASTQGPQPLKQERDNNSLRVKHTPPQKEKHKEEDSKR